MIKIKENNKDVNEFNYLYEEVGWGAYSYECSKKALDNTLYSISIYDEDKVIGFGRLIGDGICFIYIHDVMVVPSFQSQGIGSMIMNKLLEKVKEIKEVLHENAVPLFHSLTIVLLNQVFQLFCLIQCDINSLCTLWTVCVFASLEPIKIFSICLL